MIEKKIKSTQEQAQFNFKLNLNPANLLSKVDERLMIIVKGSKNVALKVFETTDKGQANQLNSLISLDSDLGQLIFLTD